MAAKAAVASHHSATISKKSTMAKPQVKKPNGSVVARSAAQPVRNKAASIAGDNPSQGVTSAYATLASRLANRVAEIAEGITIVERPKPQAQEQDEKRKPRKLDMRLNGSSQDEIAFSAPFLDNTLQKMLQLQNRMLKSTADLSSSEGVDEKLVKEHAAQSAELSRIIALICAEKARQGA
ncbi:hypothetical protein AMS68_001598 [Peltaster fructicola]|uniref:Uncharacterized protein n=1 Tax=Peltaster fructicola TaxID=286661 RepID=A0A6H0XN57_9PEZI|nr:hypothetical protein AMS68_001598 [Peltaster fructicola]